jgi:hypothetical protein
MKSHRPWQPHMSGAPLFNPYTPTTDRNVTFEHFDLTEEQEEPESSGEDSAEQADRQPPVAEKD